MRLQGVKFTDNEEDKMRKFKGTIGALLAAAILASSFAVPVMAAEELPEQTGEEPVITEPADPAEPGSGDNTGKTKTPTKRQAIPLWMKTIPPRKMMRTTAKGKIWARVKSRMETRRMRATWKSFQTKHLKIISPLWR